MNNGKTTAACVIALLAVLLTATMADAAPVYVYRTDSNAEQAPPVLQEYDPATNTWTDRASLPALNTTQLASDGTSVYALPEDGNIYRYDRGADAWTFVMAGPAAAVGRNAIALFEILDGEFYWGDDGTSTLHYTSGGAWTSVGTPRPVSSGSDIDVDSGLIYIRTYSELGGFAFDPVTSIFTMFGNATGVGENSRVGGFYDGTFYSRTWSGNLIEIDFLTAVATDTGVPLSTTHAAMAISDDGLIYLSGYAGTETVFEVFDINLDTVTLLAPAGDLGGNSHSTLAVVNRAIPEPGTLVLLGLGGLGLLVVARRRRG